MFKEMMRDVLQFCAFVLAALIIICVVILAFAILINFVGRLIEKYENDKNRRVIRERLEEYKKLKNSERLYIALANIPNINKTCHGCLYSNYVSSKNGENKFLRCYKYNVNTSTTDSCPDIRIKPEILRQRFFDKAKRITKGDHYDI